MVSLNRQDIRNAIILVLLIIIAFICQRIEMSDTDAGAMFFFFALVRAGIFAGIIIAWGISVKRRVLHTASRRYLLAIAVLLLFWLTARTCKFMFLEGLSDAMRMCWYLYYISMIMIPLMCIFLAICLGRGSNFVMPGYMRLLYVPAVALVVCVLTNDLHNLVFSFPHGIIYFDDIYIHELMYTVTALWIGAETLIFFVLLFRRSHVPGKHKRLWLPVIPVVVAALYCAGYLIRLKWLYEIAGDMTIVYSILILLVCEACIRSGLVPSNSKYNELFSVSTVGAQITDNDYNVKYASDTAERFDIETMRMTENGTVDLGDKLLSGAKVCGGHVLWTEDVSSIKKLISMLEDTRAELTEKNNLLKAEVDIKKKQAQTNEQMRLYDKIAQETTPQLNTLEKILSGIGNKEDEREKLARICVISSYIKRRSNLVLLGEEANYLPAQELEFCMRESVENVRLCGVAVSLVSRCEGIIRKDDVLLCYEFFENTVEAVLHSLTALLVNVCVEKERIVMSMCLSCGPEEKIIFNRMSSLKNQEAADSDYLNSMKNAAADIDIEIQEGDIHISFRIPKGGECK